jgi:septum site-determining protein MinD
MTCRIVSIYSPKGGVGKSFIAANLAVDLYLETKKQVLLFDFTQPFSMDAGALLNTRKLKKIENILPSVAKLQPTVLRSLITPHALGISIMALSDGRAIITEKDPTPDQIEALIGKVHQYFDYILVDSGTQFDRVAEKAFDLSDMILLPVIPDHLAIQQTRAALDLFRNRNFPTEKIQIVVNMSGMNPAVSKDLVDRLTGLKSDVAIPFDKSASSVMMEGVYPVSHPKHEITKAFDRLTLSVIRLNGNKARFHDFRGNHGAAAGKNQQMINSDFFNQLKLLIHEKLLQTVDFKQLDMKSDTSPEDRAILEQRIREKISEIIDTETTIQERTVRNELLRQVFLEALGLGPLEDLLADKEISEIMVNRFDTIYVEKNGKIETVETKFPSEMHLRNIIDRIVSPLGRKIDTSTPMVDARLKDGSRVNAIIPPLAPDGSVVTIRKFPEERLVAETLVEIGTWNRQVLEFLKTTIKAKLNVIVSGGTGTGKTTLLNILSSFIPRHERIVTIEDSAELNLPQPHVITLESRQVNIEGRGEVSIRDLVRNSLRMRPDRIIVGECRGGEALDMLQAMNTGHDGSLTTIHANSAREALSRLETLVLYAGFELPSQAIKQQIVGSIDIIVHIARFRDGSRKVVQVSEVTGMEGETITTGDIFVYKQAGEKGGKVAGAFSSTGYIPECLERFQEKGLKVPREIFWTSN